VICCGGELDEEEVKASANDLSDFVVVVAAVLFFP